MSGQRILVPLDGSQLAEAALPWAERLALALDAQLILLRTAEAHALPGRSPADHELRALAAAQQYLTDLVRRLTDAGVKAWPLVAYGKPGDHIADAAKGHEASMIVMSTHGRSGIGRWVFGSVADQVVRSAAVPVLLVRGLAAPIHPLRRLLVPLDGSPLAEQALGPAEELARLVRLDLVLLRVVLPRIGAVGGEFVPYAADVDAVDREEAWAYLNAVAEDLRRRGNTVVTAVEPDPADKGYAISARPGEVITSFAKEHQVSLIAMCGHCRSGVTRLLLGSVATEVVQTTPVPVMLLNSARGSGRPIAIAAREAGEA